MLKAKDESYNYISERELLVGHWCKLIYSETLNEIWKEGKQIMKKKTIERIANEVERVAKDWDYCDLPTKQEIYMAEERENAYNEGHNQGYSEGSKHKKISIIKQMLESALPKELIAK